MAHWAKTPAGHMRSRVHALARVQTLPVHQGQGSVLSLRHEVLAAPLCFPGTENGHPVVIHCLNTDCILANFQVRFLVCHRDSITRCCNSRTFTSPPGTPGNFPTSYHLLKAWAPTQLSPHRGIHSCDRDIYVSFSPTALTCDSKPPKLQR